MTAADFEAAGLYDPRAANAAERLELLEFLAAWGATLEQMVEAARLNRLTALAADLLLKRGQRYGLADVAALTGLSEERIRDLSLAVGLPFTFDRDRVTDEHVQMFGAFSGAAAFFGEDPLLRLLRVVGASLARIAEAAISLFYVNVEGPMRKQGTTERAIAEVGLRSIQAIDSLQAMINGLLRAHMEVAIDRFRRLDLGRSVDTAHMTVGFVDLVGFTTLSGRLSASDLARLIERFEERAFDVVTARGGRLVKLIGDEVMFVTVTATAACDTALALCEEFASDPAVTPRGALATGELVIRGGDYYGPIVNLASRLAELAVPRELLVTAAVAAEASSDALRFEPAGRRMLKGFEEPVALLTVERV